MFFPFEDYIHSNSESEYASDLRKKNNIVKFVNVLSQAPDDYVAFFKFCNTILFFRNVFCKDAFLYFFLNKFEETDRRLLGRVVFEMFVKSNKGIIGEHKVHYNLSCELYKDVISQPIIEESFNKTQRELPLL